ncbi:MAG: hypothetical protein [Bacteriophage sp.]|nr:MAG: hypothetical protein [Bacteriophage sp.]
MGESIRRVVGKLRDMVETYGAKALLASMLVIATTCVGSVSTMLRIDAKTTLEVCASMAFYGFCLGWLCKWVVVEKLPLWRMRRALRDLPRDMCAVLFAAYRERGPFDRSGDFSESRAGANLEALEYYGVLERVDVRGNECWVLAKAARHVLDRSAYLRSEIEGDYASWVAALEDREHERRLETAKRDLFELSEFGVVTIVDLLKVDCAVPVERNEMEAIVRHVGNKLIDVRRTGDGKFLISASAIAREAAPLVFADQQGTS